MIILQKQTLIIIEDNYKFTHTYLFALEQLKHEILFSPFSAPFLFKESKKSELMRSQRKWFCYFQSEKSIMWKQHVALNHNVSYFYFIYDLIAAVAWEILNWNIFRHLLKAQNIFIHIFL